MKNPNEAINKLDKIRENFKKIDIEAFEQIQNLQLEETSNFPGLNDDEVRCETNARNTLGNISSLLNSLEEIFAGQDTIHYFQTYAPKD